MPYYLLQDFAAGLDHRKSVITSKPGALRVLKNGFVNAGGEIEKRYRRTKIATITSDDTVGLAFHESQLYVFGVADPGDVTGLPTVVTYQQLVLDTPGPTITKILSAETFGDKLYVIAIMSDDSEAHFYDGVEVDINGQFALSYKKKMFTIDGRNLRSSAVGRPDITDPANTAGPDSSTIPGASIIDMKQEDGTGGDLVSLVPYYSFLAVMARTSIQLWAMDPDPDLSQQIQPLTGIGLIARHAAAPYANGDVLFLADSGIRSIRARDSSNAAVLNDIGSPLDAIIRTKRIADFAGPDDPIFATTDPLTGHWWLQWGTDAYVLAYYPLSKVTAWSHFEFETPVDYMVRGSTRLFSRSGDDIYIYGAISLGGDPLDDSAGFPPLEEWYDDTEITVQTPMIDIDDPAQEKHWTGLDIACTGVWTVSVAVDPLNPDVWTPVGVTDGTTYPLGRWSIDHRSTHLAVKMTSTSPDARLSAIGLHYVPGVAK